MLLRTVLTLLFLGIWTSFLPAQIPSFTLKRYDDVPELMNAQLKVVFPDSKGFLWLVTDAGLVRFDGSSFKAFRNVPGDSSSLAYNHLACITEDKAGDIWVGLWRNGISRYDRKTGRFRNYNITRNLKPSTAIVVGIFVDQDGFVWAGVTENGLVRLDPATGATQRFDMVTRQSAPHLDDAGVAWTNQAYQFWQDHETGLVWLSTRDGFYVLDPRTGKCEPRRSNAYENNDPGSYNNWDLLADGDYLWSGGWASGLKCINRKTNAQNIFFYNSLKEANVLTNIVNGIAPLDEDHLWVATQDRGMGIFNKKTEQFHFFDNEAELYPGFSKGAATYPVTDPQKNTWYCSNNLLTRITPDNALFRSDEVPPKLPNTGIRNIFDDREGRLLFLAMQNSSGLYVLDRKTGEAFFSKPDNPAELANLHLVMGTRQGHDGRIWTISRNKLYRFDPVTRRLTNAVQPGGANGYLYTTFEVDHKGWFWMGTSGAGLLHFNPENGETESVRANENDPNAFPSDVVGVLALDGKGRCWLGSLDKTYYGYWLPDKRRFVRLDPNGQITANSYSQRTNGIVADSKGNIWVSSESGLLYFDCSGAQPVFVKKYTMASGLPSDYVVRTAEDRQGNIWGIAFREVFLLDRKTDRITAFGKSDGFNFMEPWAIYAGRDGLMYVYGATGKYWYFDPATIQKKVIHPRIALISFLADGKEIYTGSEPAPVSPVVVPTDCRYFSLGFAVLDFVNPAKYELEYQLEGLDNTWVPVGAQRFFGFSGVPAGKYVFRIKFAGAPDEQAVSIPLVVKVSFYQTAWFWYLVLALMAAGGWYYFLVRQRQQRRLQELEGKTRLLEKEKAVVMYESLKQQLNPHFLFNSLTSLGSLIVIDPKAAAAFLENLSKTYRYILRSSDYEQVPLSDELKFAESFISLQKTRFGAGLEVQVDVPEEFRQRKIVPVTLQNLLENAIKHNVIDEETPLVVTLFVEKEYLVVRNPLQRKKYVETSNRKGLEHLQTFYRYLTDRPIGVLETPDFFEVRIPLL